MPHTVSVTPDRSTSIVNAPTFYMAPSLTQLQELSLASAPLREALKNPPSNPNCAAPARHPDGILSASGRQNWNANGQHWIVLDGHHAASFSNGIGGAISTDHHRIQAGHNAKPHGLVCARAHLEHGHRCRPGRLPSERRGGRSNREIYRRASPRISVSLRPTPMKLSASVRLSSAGRACLCHRRRLPVCSKRSLSHRRASPSPLTICGPATAPSSWNRAIPIRRKMWSGRWFALRRSASWPIVLHKDWKGDFILVDAKGSRLAKQPVHWLEGEDGSFVGTSAFQLGDPKLKLEDGEYAHCAHAERSWH